MVFILVFVFPSFFLLAEFAYNVVGTRQQEMYHRTLWTIAFIRLMLSGLLVFLFLVSRQVVVYEANVKNGAFDAANPILVYWMDIDPEYVKANRAKGVMTDKEELGSIEWSMAYGVTASAGDATKVPIKLTALPEKPSHLVFDASGHPRLESQINGSTAYMTVMHFSFTALLIFFASYLIYKCICSRALPFHSHSRGFQYIITTASALLPPAFFKKNIWRAYF
jgi:hypothetical protein